MSDSLAPAQIVETSSTLVPRRLDALMSKQARYLKSRT